MPAAGRQSPVPVSPLRSPGMARRYRKLLWWVPRLLGTLSPLHVPASGRHYPLRPPGMARRYRIARGIAIAIQTSRACAFRTKCATRGSRC
ncbi:hypothetical protein BN1263560172 [Stenotrophomonas indicatrix]|nr:hypothetical protein BN1263560172 [Stenotrophomonas indicatrix]